MARHLIVRSAALVLVSGVALLAAIGGPIAADKAQEAVDREALCSVLPEAACGVFVKCTFVRAPADTFAYYAGYRAPDTTGLVGYAVTARKRGYSSSILTLAGVGLDGRIVGIKILSQKETPKTGAKIVEPTVGKPIADVAKGRAGSAGVATVAIRIASGSGDERCALVRITDTLALTEIEKALSGADTSAVASLAPKTFVVEPRDTARAGDREYAVEISTRVIQKLREDAVPWWQQQFIGKTAPDLVVTKEKSAKTIQAVTGATISSMAVTESVKAAITTLGEATGGFKGAKP